jgi:hypothetical protein
MEPSIGRIVHYVLSNGRSKGEHRPAIIVRVWPKQGEIQLVQLQVFTDGSNDFSSDQVGYNGSFWATSVHQDEVDKKESTWHWPERV